jgi:hypothetical protein
VEVAPSITSCSSRLLVTNDPPFVDELDRLLDFEAPQNILIDVDNLILLKNQRLGKDRLLAHLDGSRVDRDVPVTEDLLVHQETDDILDFLHLLVGADAADSQTVTHGWARSDRIGDAVDSTELRRKVDVLVSVLHHDERLLEVGDGLIVHDFHVLSHRDLFVVVNELFRHWVGVPVDSRDPVSALVAPISDDARVYDLKLNQFFELAVVSGVSFKVIDFVETSNG